jgi:murein L,D-transpeptidase YafK
VRAILERELSAVSVPYPPRRFALVAIKSEGRLHLYVGTETGYRHVRSYPILAASGTLGPKLREGDRQVPEGFYRIESLNPNSRFHLSLRLDYPNAEDLAQAAKDGRSDPGGDIMIHGGSASIGCLAIGDPAIEELFVLAADAGIASAEVLIVPVDLRTEPPPASAIADRTWVSDLYERLATALRAFPPPRGG